MPLVFESALKSSNNYLPIGIISLLLGLHLCHGLLKSSVTRAGSATGDVPTTLPWNGVVFAPIVRATITADKFRILMP
ncbi:hypothetical protein FNV43_RR08435 [Rhamnella rubrinervis]|uniref:Uncharacterized protein n=1 Tax=Rhamnella rubrinervis TaxID=2594499 RepID=A0A8K0H8B7_9ROSA|nr:hypothetical protein FNV43_RR08435 [Rhamnella rubrinervis]